MAFQAFNKNLADRWIASTSSGYVGLDFGASTWAISRYTMTCSEATRAPNTWTFEGSVNGSSWTVLDTQTSISNWGTTPTQTFSFSNSTKYRYYRLNASSNNGDSFVGIFELDMLVHELFNFTVTSTETDIYGPTYIKNTAGTSIFSVDTATPLITSAASITLSDTTSTIIKSKAASGLILRNDASSGSFGIVELSILNIGGKNGAEFAQRNNAGAEVVDFLFTCYNPGTTTEVTRNIRYENRTASTFIGTAPEFQIGPAGLPRLCINDNIVLVRLSNLQIEDARDIVFSTTTGTKIGTATTQKIGVWNTTPIVRPSAYTQTYATADKTHAAFTSSDLTGITSSTTGSALAEPSATYTQSEMQQNFRRIQDQFVALRADVADLKQLVNSIIDDQQAIGWFA